VFAFLVIVFVVVPLVELAVIIEVGSRIGVLDTIGLLLLVSIVGAYVVKRQGISVWRRMRAQAAAGQVPGMELVDGACVLAAGLLLVFPGFVTDALGLLLLVPPVRSIVRGMVRRRFRSTVTVIQPVVSYRRDRRPDDGPPGPALPPGAPQ
jgi:UPF0716 protein FxsA